MVSAVAGVLPACDGDETLVDPPPEGTDCAANEMRLVDGSCLAVGVPPDRCGDGFVTDEVGGCVAILPETPCPLGLMALPGETACREVAPCGEGPFPDLPPEALAAAQYVDASASAAGDGSVTQPWQTMGEALSAAATGAVIAVAAGTYGDNLVLSDKAVRIWGRCPALVELRGAASEPTLNIYTEAANGTEVRGIAITGGQIAVAATGVRGLVLDRVWIRDGATVGAYFADDLGQPEVLIRDSLLEANSGYGVFGRAALVTIERTVVRDTAFIGDDFFGYGILVITPSDGAEGSLLLRTSLIERNHGHGVQVNGAPATIDAVLIRDTLPLPDQSLGRGLGALNDTERSGGLLLTGSVVERNHEVGIYVAAVSATIETTVVRDMFAVNPVLPNGAGIVAQQDPVVALPTELTVRSSLVERTALSGIQSSGASVRVESTVVRDIASASLDGSGGRCVALQYHTITGVLPTGELTAVWLTGCRDFGLAMISGGATVVGSRIESVLPRAADGLFGDGIMVAAGNHPSMGPFEAHLLLSGMVVRESSRAGVTVFGAAVTIGDSAVECNPFDLDGESYLGRDWSVDDLGGNRCGCGDEIACKVVTSSLEPPAPP